MIEIIRFIITVLLNFFGYIIIGFLFQQITKTKITLLEWCAIIMFVQIGSIAFGVLAGNTLKIGLLVIKDIAIILGFMLISYRHNPKLEIRYHIFYALYPNNLYMIIQGVFGYTIMGLFSIKITPMAAQVHSWLVWLITTIAIFVPPIFYHLLSKWLNIDISNVSKTIKYYVSPKMLVIVNILMLMFCPGMECFATFTPFEDMSTNRNIYRAVIFLYFILLFVFLFYLNFRHGQEQKEELLRNQEMELTALENYSKHVESLYQEVRSFRHDYANVLMTLKMGIDQGNLDDIKKIYEEITADSTKLVKNNKFDLLTSQTAASKVSCQPNSCKLKIKGLRLA